MIDFGTEPHFQRETPEAIPLTPEVDYQGFPNANGIRIIPDGKYIIFADSNDGKLYRMVPRRSRRSAR